MAKTKILFVCLGNICRSPMAEFVLKDMAAKAGRTAEFEIASAATSNEECGSPVHPGTRQVLAQHGIACAGKTARQLCRADYTHYDLLVGMDEANLRAMQRICGPDADDKMRLLLAYTGENRSVADPWYTHDFATTYRDIAAGCAALLQTL